MPDIVRLLHSVRRDRLDTVLSDGLTASSAFDDLGSNLRRGVVYCWLRKEHDRMWGGVGDFAYVEVEVQVGRCRVAEMDLSSLALMYLQGQGGRPVNRQAAQFLTKAYELTSCSLEDYVDGMFSTPEVLIRGDVGPESIRMP